MSFLRKNWLLVGFVLLLLLVPGAIYYFASSKKAPVENALIKVQKQEEVVIEDVLPSELGLVLLAQQDKKSIDMTLSKLTNITSIEYEADYEAEGAIPRGVIGTIIIKPSDKQVTRNVLLGTCSANKCKYDTGVREVRFTLRINYSNGKVGSLQQTVSL